MSTLYVSEYAGLATGPGRMNQIPLVLEPAKVEQTVAIGGASQPSAAFGADTIVIRVHTDAICSIVIGKAPVATLVSKRMAADQTEYFGVSPGDKIAVIANT